MANYYLDGGMIPDGEAARTAGSTASEGIARHFPPVAGDETRDETATQGLRSEVLAFAWQMELKMRQHDAKRGTSWRSESPEWLMNRAADEWLELQAAKRAMFGERWPFGRSDFIDEAVDVANFLWMAAFNAGAMSDILPLAALRPAPEAAKPVPAEVEAAIAKAWGKLYDVRQGEIPDQQTVVETMTKTFLALLVPHAVSVAPETAAPVAWGVVDVRDPRVLQDFALSKAGAEHGIKKLDDEWQGAYKFAAIPLYAAPPAPASGEQRADDDANVTKALRIADKWRDELPHIVQPEGFIVPFIALADAYRAALRARPEGETK